MQIKLRKAKTMNNEVFKRGQVCEDRCGGLIMIVAVSPRGEDYEVEYVHEDGYLGSFYASHAPILKPYTTTERGD